MGLSEAHRIQCVDAFAVDAANYQTAGSMATLTASTTAASGATSSLSLAFTGLKKAFLSNPIFWFVTALTIAIPVINHFHTSLKDQLEINEELKSSLDETSSKIEEFTSQIEENSKRIKELQELGPLKITEQDELTRLQLENEELERRLTLQQEYRKQEVAELNEGIEKAFKKDFLRKDIVIYDAEIDTGVYKTEKEYFDELILRGKELVALGDKRTLNEQQELETIQGQVAEMSNRLITQTEGYEAITDAQKEQQKVWDQMEQDAAFIIDPAKYQGKVFDEIWNSNKFANAKSELIKLSKAGELSPETLQTSAYYQLLLEKTCMTAEELCEHINSITKLKMPTVPIERKRDEFVRLNKELYEYQRIIDQAGKRESDFYGNVDLNNRPIILNADDYNTILGESRAIESGSVLDGGEIMYTPILPTGEILDEQILTSYLNRITRDAQSKSDVLNADKNGLKIVFGIADTVDEANNIMIKLHDGQAELYDSQADAMRNIAEITPKIAALTKSLGEQVYSLDDLTSSIETYSSSTSLISKASEELAETGNITDETKQSLIATFGDLDNALEKTATGYRINTDAVAAYSEEQRKLVKSDIEQKMLVLSNAYNDNFFRLESLKNALKDGSGRSEEFKNAIEEQINVLEHERSSLEGSITNLKLLESQYLHTLNAHTKFMTALSSEDAGANYDSIVSSFETINEQIAKGLVGTDQIREYINYFTFEDLDTASIDELLNRLEEIPKLTKYFTEDSKGIDNFIAKLNELGYATKGSDGFWNISIESVEKLASELDISTAAVENLLDKSKDYGASIDYKEVSSGIIDLGKQYQEAADRIAEITSEIEAGNATKELKDELKQLTADKYAIEVVIETYNRDEALAEARALQEQINSMPIEMVIGEEGYQNLIDELERIKSTFGFTDEDLVINPVTSDGESAEDGLFFDLFPNSPTGVDKYLDDITSKTYELDFQVSKNFRDIIRDATALKNGVISDTLNGKSSSESIMFGNADGSYKAGVRGKSLVGELGKELLVRDGAVYPIGENGAEIIDIKPDDIIFNHKQTDQIEKRGKTNSRGKLYGSFADGTTTTSSSGNYTSYKSDSRIKNYLKGVEYDFSKSGDAVKDANKALDDTLERLDWIPRKIEEIEESYSKLISEANNGDNTFANQLNFLNAAIDKQEELIDVSKQAEALYKLEYETLASTLSAEERALVENGAIKLSSYSKDDAERIGKADDAWKTYQDMVKSRKEAERELFDNQRLQHEKEIEWKKSEIDELVEKSDIEQTAYAKQLDYLNTAKSKSDALTIQLTQYADQANVKWKEVKDTINAIDIAKIMTGSLNIEDYENLPEYQAALKVAMLAYEDYQDSEKALNEQIRENAELAKQAFEKAIEVVQAQQDLVNANISSTEKTMDLINAVGGNVHESMYKSMISDNKEVIDLYEEQIALIEDRIAAVKPESAEYYELQAQLQDCEQAIMDCKIQQAEWNEAIKRLPIDRLSTYIQLQNIKQDLQNFIDEVGVLGIAPNKEQYQSFIDMNQKEIDALVKQQIKLKDILGDYKYGSEKFTEVSNEIQDIENQISNLITQQREYNDAILQLPIQKLEQVYNSIAAAKTSLENSIAEDNAKGLSTTIGQYRDLNAITVEQLRTLNERRNALSSLLDVYEKDSEKYVETQNAINGINDEMSNLVQQQYKWNQEILNIPINNLEKINDNLSSYSSILGDVLSDYDSALEGINALVDAEIKGIQNSLDLLSESNEARKIQLSLEQASYNLERAKTQLTTKVIRDGKAVYVENQDAVRSAQQELADAQYGKMVYDLEQQKEKLEDIKTKWSEIKQEVENVRDIQKADNIFGADSGWKDSVLSGDDNGLQALFKNLYESTYLEKESVDKQIASNERLTQIMGEFVTRYQEGSLTYEQALSGISDMVTSMEGGYTALENLAGMLNLDNINGLENITASTQASIAESAELLSQYMQIANSNANSVKDYETMWNGVEPTLRDHIDAFNELAAMLDEYIKAFSANDTAIDANAKTWTEMRAQIQAELEALEKAAAELEKWANSNQNYSSGSSGGNKGSSSSSGSGSSGSSTIWAGGEAHSESKGSAADIIMNYGSKAEQDRYWKYRESVINNSPQASNEAWKDAALKALDDEKNKYHTGIEKGFVDSKNSSLERLIKSVAINPLKADEVLSVLQKGEGVFTQPQMQNMLNNSMLMGRMLEKTSGAIHTSGAGGQLIDCSIGEIHLHEVQNVDGLAKALDQHFASTMKQQMSKYKLSI